MRRFFSRLFNEKQEATTREEISLSDMMSFLETKVFPCSECGHFFQLDKPEPLSISTCSQCGAGNFVPKKVGPFWLYRFLGDGGMSRVYKATCSLVPGVEYAVKILPQHQRGNKDLETLLQRESEMTALFNEHENSITVVEFDIDGDIAYLATEYEVGRTLNKYIEEGHSQVEMIDVAMQLLSIIEFIFSKGYLFRDLKPQNIIVNQEGKVILLDYGLCLPKGSAAYQGEGDVDGSPHYVPPERLTGQGEDIRSEIYSIGMLLFHMLTGHTFFSGNDLQEIAELHVNAPRPENMSPLMPGVHEELVNLVARMIKKKKRMRCQSLTEVKGVLHYVNRKLTSGDDHSISSITGIKID